MGRCHVSQKREKGKKKDSSYFGSAMQAQQVFFRVLLFIGQEEKKASSDIWYSVGVLRARMAYEACMR